MKIIAVLVIMLFAPLTAWGADYNTAYNAAEKGENIFYGAGAFLRHKIIPQIFTKAEFIYYSFESTTNILPSGYTTKRLDAPMILLGAGYIHQL